MLLNDFHSTPDAKDSTSLAATSEPTNHPGFEITVADASNRIESIDFLRGLVMIIMALDHVRGYLHFDSLIYSATDLQHTTPPWFATRLITHLCAPTFIFLAGASAYFIAQRKGLYDTSYFLITRGLWLIALQVTLIRFAWNFDPAFHYNSSNIISTIGFCMIALSALIHLRIRTILIIGLIIVLAHNTLDNISFKDGSLLDIFWTLMHIRKLYSFENNYSFLVLYPILPWIGVMALGYCLGSLYGQGWPSEKRMLTLLQIGGAGLILFFVLRWTNLYGDPTPWTQHPDPAVTVMSFFNVEKYPPSLLFLSLTLGLSIILLGILEGMKLWQPIVIFGKVALFYFVIHIFVIHAIAVLAVIWSGYPWQTMIFTGPNYQGSPLLKGKFGFSLGEVYLWWALIVLLLYPVCHYWNALKIRNKRKWWASYI